MKSDSEAEESDDDDPSIVYARLRLRLTLASRNRTAGPEDTKRMQARLDELKSDYLFRQDDADREYHIRLKEADDAALLARLRNLATPDPAPVTPSPKERPAKGKMAKPRPVDIKTSASSPADVSTPSGDLDDEGPMLGNLMDVPTATESSTNGVTIAMREVPLPRQWAGRTPKKLLEETVHKLHKTASILYTCVSGGSRAVRASVTIRMPARRTEYFEMSDIACPDQQQAEQYIALVALHRLTFPPQTGFASGGSGNAQTYYRLLPPIFLDVWHELEARRKEEEEDTNRKIWSKLHDILEAKKSGLNKVG